MLRRAVSNPAREIVAAVEERYGRPFGDIAVVVMETDAGPMRQSNEG
jgi:hypothetical protein